MIKIYLADVTLYYKQTNSDIKKKKPIREFIVKDVVCKRIPLRFHLNEGDMYKRVVRGMGDKTLSEFQDDPTTGLKKFTITYKKEI